MVARIGARHPTRPVPFDLELVVLVGMGRRRRIEVPDSLWASPIPGKVEDPGEQTRRANKSFGGVLM
jgi:hypothetical protein